MKLTRSVLPARKRLDYASLEMARRDLQREQESNRNVRCAVAAAVALVTVGEVMRLWGAW